MMLLIFFFLGFLYGVAIMTRGIVFTLREMREKNIDLELQNLLLQAALHSTRRTNRLISRTTVPKHAERN